MCWRRLLPSTHSLETMQAVSAMSGGMVANGLSLEVIISLEILLDIPNGAADSVYNYIRSW